MSDPNQTPPGQQAQQPPQPPQPELVTELQQLGQHIEAAIRTALDSERARQVQQDIAKGMQEIGVQLQSAVQTIQQDPRVQSLAEKGQEALERARENPVVRDFQDAMARGISQLNAQLNSFINKMQTSGGAPSAGARNVPIEDEPPPTTGETTRLDPKKDEW